MPVQLDTLPEDVKAEPLTEDEWMRRLRARLLERGGDGADQVADCCSYAEWREGFENDPEGAADEEMSYWTDDGDE